ncbi:Rap guanine nucleotide exchange factor 1 [Armadillidium nasatum]|uniref:Rap guanine nucleotide exchange factor 1 n=1 Tax=Armadillidium nasatum TaxID=96803 RepID=A0A5N5T1L9_9CRUS|nr:Rap guanine nucleotide exchange factor 1 [Armadillidium nasatum]
MIYSTSCEFYRCLWPFPPEVTQKKKVDKSINKDEEDHFHLSCSNKIGKPIRVLGKTVPVKGHSVAEELDKKQGEIFRLLECSEDAVKKDIPAYLVGFPSMILENVIALTREIDQMTANANSSELASLLSHMNQTVAEHALWIDHYYLYGDSSHCDQSIQSIVRNVRQAVKSLIEFAVNKENEGASETNFFNTSENSHNESNSSLCSQDSPYSRKKLNETRNRHTHGSMPEIPSVANSYGNSGRSLSRKTSPPPNKLTHSFSSDSILDNKENSVNSTPAKHSIYVGDYEGTSSCDESSAPPIPPKKNIKGRSSLRSSYEFDSPVKQGSNCNSSFDGGTDFIGSRRSAGLMISCSTPQSLDHSLEYSVNNSLNNSSASHDSVHHQTPNNNYHYSGGGEQRRGGIGASASLNSMEMSPRVTDLTSMLSHNCEISSLRSMTDDSTSSGYTTSSTMNNTKAYYSQSFHSFNHENKSTSVIDSGKDSIITQVNSSNSQQQQQHSLVIRRSSRNSACSSSSRSSGSEVDSSTLTMTVPPPIPEKTRQTINSFPICDRAQSHYDNVDGITSLEKLEAKHFQHVKTQEINSISYSASSSTSELGSSKSSMTSWESTNSSSSPASNSIVQRRYNESHINHSTRRSNADKPPLPPKQRHIMEYMQIFKDYQMPEKEWFQHRRSQQILGSYQSHVISVNDEFKDFDLETHALSSRVPPSDKPKSEAFVASDNWNHPELCSCQVKETPSNTAKYLQPPPAHPSVGNDTSRCKENSEEKQKKVECVEKKVNNETLPEQEFIEDGESNSLLDSLNVTEHIIFQGEPDVSDVKAASIDALVVYATYSKNETYLEAFLTTYRTFLTPVEVIAKLFYRYNKFVCRSSTEYQKAAKNAFSLLVRVVHDLVVTELTEDLLKDLAQFEYNLLAKGDLKLALYFRKKLSEKLKLRKTHQEHGELPCHYLTIKNQHQYTFLDFKSSEIADQMTLLDSELFSKFGIPELLHYSRDQDEEHCPNLAQFAMQINRMSSWVKTLILRSNSQDREKYYKKFIKIMKHLRKVNNNYNSCIAILSGLESADVRRLDWPKASMDMLKEYCDLFDFEGSYRAYRQALAETKPPCIPHLGIILQDLTKLYHINPNFVDGKVNFLKRWLQFNILEDMKRFIPSKYDIRKNESIRNFINNYEDCMSDSDLWDLSLAIKPKAKSK